ncbi:hypothetical protein KKH43_04285 [Patescibacteria group bacterium]|nr:hypothetical protein [Patescibacteria group bacterium]
MKTYFYCALAVLLAFIQLSFFSSFYIFGATVSIVLVMLLALIITKDTRNAYFCALASGLVLDMHSELFFGHITLLLLLVVFLSTLILKIFLEHSTIFAKVALSFIATIGFALLQYVFLYGLHVVGVVGLKPILTFEGIVDVFISAILNTLVLFLVVKGILFFNMYFDKREYRSNSFIS